MVDLLDELLRQLRELLAVIPNIISAAAIFFVGWLLATLLAKVVKRVLRSVGADTVADRLNDIELVDRSNIKLIPSKFFSKAVYYIILFVFLMAAVNALGMDSISRLMEDIISYLPKAISAFFVFIIGIVISDAIKKIVLTTCESLGIPAGRMIATVVFYFLFLNVIMITLKQADLQTAFMEANISIILGGVVLAFSLGYGLASRDLMANILSSFYNKERLNVGDEVSIDGVAGTIQSIDTVCMTLKTKDAEVLVPLNKLSRNSLTIYRRGVVSGTPSGPTEV